MIFITGVSGFIGQNLASHMVCNGFDVSGLVRETSRKEHLDSRIKLFTGDIRHESTLFETSLAGVKCFVHCASIINPPDQKESTIKDANIKGTVNVLNWIRKSAKTLDKFIYISSVGAMGRIENPPVNESYLGKTINSYQLSKKEGEFIVREFCQANGINYIIIRPSWVYGPGDRRVFKFIRAISKKRMLRVGNCQTLIHPLHVYDLANGLLSTIKSDISNETFILAGPETCTVDETINTISELVDTKVPKIRFPYPLMYLIALFSEIIFPLFRIEPPIFRRRLDFFRENQGFDIQKARRLLGYMPLIKLKEGMETTITWYRDKGWL